MRLRILRLRILRLGILRLATLKLGTLQLGTLQLGTLSRQARTPRELSRKPLRNVLSTVSTLSVLTLVMGFTTGCEASGRDDQALLKQIAEHHDLYMKEFQAAKDELASHTYLPQRRDFGEHGTIIVRDCYLAGRPRKEYLRLNFTYINTSDRTVKTARVTLTLRDPDTETEWHETMDLIMPLHSLTPDSSYTTWFEMPTRDVHRHPNWSWEIGVEALGENGTALGQQ